MHVTQAFAPLVEGFDLEAHDIHVPAVVKDNISPVIAVDVHATLNPR